MYHYNVQVSIAQEPNQIRGGLLNMRIEGEKDSMDVKIYGGYVNLRISPPRHNFSFLSFCDSQNLWDRIKEFSIMSLQNLFILQVELLIWISNESLSWNLFLAAFYLLFVAEERLLQNIQFPNPYWHSKSFPCSLHPSISGYFPLHFFHTFILVWAYKNVGQKVSRLDTRLD